MSSAPIPAAVPKRSMRTRARDFWARVTEGLEIEQLWGQFRAEAEASYGLYSKDVDWDVIRSEKRRWKRPLLAGWALFQALLMKLSPARRVLLLVAIVLLVVQPEIHTGEGQSGFSLGALGAMILFLLLALELADRVTMKRDLEIAREIQQWLVPDHPPHVAGADIAFATRPQTPSPVITTTRSRAPPPQAPRTPAR